MESLAKVESSQVSNCFVSRFLQLTTRAQCGGAARLLCFHSVNAPREEWSLEISPQQYSVHKDSSLSIISLENSEAPQFSVRFVVEDDREFDTWFNVLNDIVNDSTQQALPQDAKPIQRSTVAVAKCAPAQIPTFSHTLLSAQRAQ
mmetsp:Transcript_3588/g.7842  ORF Transcript_3588/g.7842 Transcript_3588/m.7842 type:complete len:146 (-) Transcript_3588:396-833(-)